MVSFADIIFLALVAVFVFTRLYSVFGTRSSEKKVRIVVKAPDKDTEKKIVENITKIISHSEEENKEGNVNFEQLTEQDKLLTKITGFNKEQFLHSARRVFEVILQSFNSGNLLPIKELISKKIWDSWNIILSERQANNITAEVDFICFDKSEIKDVKLLKNSVKIVVEFVSEQVNILKNAQGEVIEGDENYVQKITDIWTFERALNAKNNNWTLVSTKKTC